MKRNRYVLLILSMILLSLCTMTGCAGKGSDKITSSEQLNEEGRKIGVASDTAEDRLVAAELPKAEIQYFADSMSGYTSVAQGKIDAFVFDKLSMEMAIYHGLKGVRLLNETLGEGLSSGVAFSPVTKIPDLESKFNAFLEEIRSDGTLEDMKERWLVRHEEEMPEIPLPEKTNTHLVAGTSGSNMPFTYFIGTELAGYDIELARRFAAWLGADLKFKVYNYEGIVPAAQSGDVDCIFANLFITPERKDAIAFSEPTYVGEIGVLVQDKDNSAQTASDEQAGSTGQSGFTSLSDIEDKRIGVVTGGIESVQAENHFPDAELYFFDTDVDMLNALRAHKIDAFASASGLVNFMMTENPDLTCLDETIADGMLEGAIFPKTDSGQALCDEFSEFLREIKENGVYDEILDNWFGADGGKRVSYDLSKLSPTRGTLKMATDTSMVPFVFIKDGQLAGIDMDVVVRFCEEYGYGLEPVPMNFAAIIPAVTSEKVDFAWCCISYTPERAESVLYSEFAYEGSTVIAVLKENDGEAGGSFIDSVKDSFYKTFIREDRWKLFLSGIGTTLLITVLSLLFGTLLGFFVFMLCRNGNRAANTITRFFVWLVHGTPVVVLLMILYYIIFSSVAISGTVVSIIGFTLVFGSGVFGMIKSGVGAIDRGQLEAAYTLGFTNRRAFFRIILPQALPHFMPAYKASITDLIKATAVVGYVAVQDLTKMGDIIRSRTYEAFFPLIAVAVIYFILAAILTFIVSRIGVHMDTRHRKPEDILKGVHKK